MGVFEIKFEEFTKEREGFKQKRDAI